MQQYLSSCIKTEKRKSDQIRNSLLDSFKLVEVAISAM